MYYIDKNIPDSVKFITDFGLRIDQVEAQAKNFTSAAFYTPNIIERHSENITMMSVFDKMARERTLFLTGEVNDHMSTIITAQLLYMDQEEKDITTYTDSPGGSVKSGLTIYDTMNYISSDVVTVCTGMAASMGSIIASSGTKGKRFILPNARFMLHKVSSGARGVIDDMEISMNEAKKYNDTLFDILAKNTGKTKEQVLLDSQRDFWLNAQESLDYGLVDRIITSKKELNNK